MRIKFGLITTVIVSLLLAPISHAEYGWCPYLFLNTQHVEDLAPSIQELYSKYHIKIMVRQEKRPQIILLLNDLNDSDKVIPREELLEKLPGWASKIENMELTRYDVQTQLFRYRLFNHLFFSMTILNMMYFMAVAPATTDALKAAGLPNYLRHFIPASLIFGQVASLLVSQEYQKRVASPTQGLLAKSLMDTFEREPESIALFPSTAADVHWIGHELTKRGFQEFDLTRLQDLLRLIQTPAPQWAEQTP